MGSYDMNNNVSKNLPEVDESIDAMYNIVIQHESDSKSIDGDSLDGDYNLKLNLNNQILIGPLNIDQINKMC